MGSYKKAAAAVCFVNLVVAFFVLRSLYSLSSSLAAANSVLESQESAPNPFFDFKYSDDQIKRIEGSIVIQRELKPVKLVDLVKKLKKKLRKEEKRWELSYSVKQKLSEEILERLKMLNDSASAAEQREAVELWRIEKLKAVKKIMGENSRSDPTILHTEAKMLARALQFSWHTLSEDIGLWIPMEVVNIENITESEKQLGEQEEEIVPGRPLPSECHAELHTDYDGTAVRWGLTHHKETAADCCQACLDQAENAKPGEMKCNIWVYCPSEFGCFSPDKYEHKHQECWLKQSHKPRLNFKDKYSEEYRNSHPTAPVVVPWMSGVISL